ncbi:Hypothetical predicted protein [Lecanosticta acicola]|uniref:Uncharacterized protein n=1 Tax=Lecanosticta acicola TaxID=111012 RepID=A0AAI8Z3L3_9PEZI|nr:Hypothetical predicted protein [Lecanosticta acicola]
MAPKKSASEQTFDFETIALVIYAMLESGVTLGVNHYGLMSAADPKGRTASSFEHSFRNVKKRAKELQTTKGSNLGTSASSKSRGGAGGSKRKKAASEINSGGSADDEEQPPSKRVKPEPNSEDDASDDEL